MRWHNGRSRRSRNLQPENASKGSVTKKDEGTAHSIQARRSLLQQRPDTFAQTIPSSSFFACNTAADHTFRVGDNPLTTSSKPFEPSRNSYNPSESNSRISGTGCQEMNSVMKQTVS